MKCNLPLCQRMDRLMVCLFFREACKKSNVQKERRYVCFIDSKKPSQCTKEYVMMGNEEEGIADLFW